MPITHLRLDTHFRDFQKNDSKCQKRFLKWALPARQDSPMQIPMIDGLFCLFYLLGAINLHKKDASLLVHRLVSHIMVMAWRSKWAVGKAVRAGLAVVGRIPHQFYVGRTNANWIQKRTAADPTLLRAIESAAEFGAHQCRRCSSHPGQAVGFRATAGHYSASDTTFRECGCIPGRWPRNRHGT
jgi:hypothetical protein